MRYAVAVVGSEARDSTVRVYGTWRTPEAARAFAQTLIDRYSDIDPQVVEIESPTLTHVREFWGEPGE